MIIIAMKYENQTFSKNETVELDNNEFINCTFDNCTIIFRGETLPGVKDCNFVGYIKWTFKDYARATLTLFSALNMTIPGYGESIFKDFMNSFKENIFKSKIH